MTQHKYQSFLNGLRAGDCEMGDVDTERFNRVRPALQERGIYTVRGDGLHVGDRGILLVGPAQVGKTTLATQLNESFPEVTYFLGHLPEEETEDPVRDRSAGYELGYLAKGKTHRVFPILMTEENHEGYSGGFPVTDVVLVETARYDGNDPIFEGKSHFQDRGGVQRLAGALTAELFWPEFSPTRYSRETFAKIGRGLTTHYLINGEHLDETVQAVTERFSVR